MFRNAMRLPFKLLGIPISLDTSFLIVLPLFAFLIGLQLPTYLRLLGITPEPGMLQGSTPYLLGLLAALGLFASVLVHELGHAVAARAFGVQTREITLWLLGGVAQLTDIPRARGAEAVIAVVGPLTSLALAGVSAVLRGLVPDVAAGQFLLGYLALVNLSLALFNLLPALPLDGGRVLRSLLALRRPYLEATRTAAGVSRLIAFAMGIFGLYAFNLFLVLIALFVYMAASTETEQASLSQALEGLRVRDLMTLEVRSVPPTLSVGELLQRMFLERHMGYPVVEEGRVVGLISLEDLQGADPAAPITERMGKLEAIAPEASALEALKRMAECNFSRLVVMENGRMVGILSKTDLLRALQVRLVGQTVRPGGSGA
ncbi:putative zinc metalloprotease Rip3 [Calidithermus terrae]|uniref:Zinc metalloprotease n=1 Tax=Calidithermus terrae TaxID=1408545 RepID=A0A399EM65_9DEIN|nr:CBS domain-containing protein [Calidithermus terrae]RIH84583.1 putative zinc metalloprotease Rip3 [Calidithermus terrae]